MKVGYVCTNYDGARVSIAAAKSFLSRFPDDGEVVIVDNDSAAADIDLLADFAENADHVEVLVTGRNAGYFAGLNAGLDAIRSAPAPCDWIFAGNNDLLFSENLRDALHAAMPTLERYPVVAPNMVTTAGVHQNPHIRTAISSKRAMLYKAYYSSYTMARALLLASRIGGKAFKREDTAVWREQGTIWAGHGSCYLLTPKFFELLGTLDVHSFLYFEEAFLAHQVERAGEKIWYEPTLEIEHACNSTIGSLPGRGTWGYSRDAYRTYRDLTRADAK